MVALAYQAGEADARACFSSMAAELALAEAYRICCPWAHSTRPSMRQDIDVPHVHQAFNWDCGLACVQMVLGAFQVDCPDVEVLRCMCDTRSVWTVDLAHLLRRFHLEVTFTTLTLGANPQYSSESFYMEHLEDDVDRVNQLFQGASAAGIILQRRSVRLKELQALMMTKEVLVIALIDKRALKKANKIWAPEPQGQQSASNEQSELANDSGYAGHYVVISGYDATEDCFSISDPALTIGHISLPSAVLEIARSAFGTDEDLLIIPQPSQQITSLQ